VSSWRDFPEQLAHQTGYGALVYSRAGYGKSDPALLPRPINFMHDEAEVLAEILNQTGVRKPIVIGHSDGASIALIYASRRNAVRPRGLIVEAPHVFAEPAGLESIAKIAEVYRTADLRERLARHHGTNTDIAFWGWNDVWLHPDFRSWNIESVLPAITTPMLIIQGEQDEYGTWRQVEAIERQASGPVEVLAVPKCGHAPHREHTDFALQAMTRFIQKLGNAE
jgi:pimeloyl-ACP methyl ester carboxylesterase